MLLQVPSGVRRPTLRDRSTLPHRRRLRTAPPVTAGGQPSAAAAAAAGPGGVGGAAERVDRARELGDGGDERPAASARRLLRSGAAGRLRGVRVRRLGPPAAPASTPAARRRRRGRATGPQQPPRFAPAADATRDRRQLPTSNDNNRQ